MAEKIEREADRYVRDKWYQHIWYHYKWVIIGVLAVVVLLSIVIADTVRKDPVDMYIIYVTEDPAVYREKTEALKKTIAPYVPDSNGDGKIVLQIKNFYIGQNYSATAVENNKNELRTIMWSGTCMFFVADRVGSEFLLAENSGAGVLESLTDIAEESSLDSDGRLWLANGTEFFKNELFEDWDSELYFGLRLYNGTVSSIQKSSVKHFNQAHQTLSNIINGKKLYPWETDSAD